MNSVIETAKRMIFSRRRRVVGGARIGLKNATWPLVTLEFSGEKISLTGYGEYLEFFPGQVVSIDLIYRFPVIATGIRINHQAHDPQPMIFWCIFSARTRQAILRSGFLPRAEKAG